MKNDIRYAFHVHTYRCGHASMETEDEYIKYAICHQMSSITFTDHAPFPGDPFTGRMKIAQLEEYLSTLRYLREKYKSEISIYCGLEVEYIPEYNAYYQYLNENFDVLILGQHHAKMKNGKYTFEKDVNENIVYDTILQSVIDGMNTGFFKVLAHPDKYFHSLDMWDSEDTNIRKIILKIAKDKDIILEKNLSLDEKNGYNRRFWDNVSTSIKTLYGIDAHCVKDMERSQKIND